VDWIVQCFTSPPTQYRFYGRRFLQVKRPNQQYQSKASVGDWLIVHVTLSPVAIAVYNADAGHRSHHLLIIVALIHVVLPSLLLAMLWLCQKKLNSLVFPSCVFITVHFTDLQQPYLKSSVWHNILWSLFQWHCWMSGIVAVVGRLPRENDRSELLNQAEPIDYSRGQSSSSTTHTDITSGLYQAGDAGPRPLQQTGGNWSIMSTSSRPSRQGPPRGIFDDIWCWRLLFALCTVPITSAVL